MEQAMANYPSNRLIERFNKPSSRSNSLVEAEYREVECTIRLNKDVIEPAWESRHAKLIYKIGTAAYNEMASIARTKGRSPKAYMGTLVNKAYQNA
jgi:hypothetical protein